MIAGRRSAQLEPALAALLATILRLRAPGMTMLRLPVFTWSMLVTCLLVVTSFPVLLVAMALLLDRPARDGGVFDRPAGRSPTSTCSGSTATRSST